MRWKLLEEEAGLLAILSSQVHSAGARSPTGCGWRTGASQKLRPSNQCPRADAGQDEVRWAKGPVELQPCRLSPVTPGLLHTMHTVVRTCCQVGSRGSRKHASFEKGACSGPLLSQDVYLHWN